MLRKVIKAARNKSKENICWSGSKCWRCLWFTRAASGWVKRFTSTCELWVAVGTSGLLVMTTWLISDYLCRDSSALIRILSSDYLRCVSLLIFFLFINRCCSLNNSSTEKVTLGLKQMAKPAHDGYNPWMIDHPNHSDLALFADQLRRQLISNPISL